MSYLELARACLYPHLALCSTWGSVTPVGVMLTAQLRLRLVCPARPTVWLQDRDRPFLS